MGFFIGFVGSVGSRCIVRRGRRFCVTFGGEPKVASKELQTRCSLKVASSMGGAEESLGGGGAEESKGQDQYGALDETYEASTGTDEALNAAEEASEGTDELLGSLSATTKREKRSARTSSKLIRASDARRRLKELITEHARGKALKKGRREEASKDFTELIAACGRSGLYQVGLDAFDEATRAIGLDADLCAAAFRAALSAKYADKALGIWDRAMERDIRLPDNIYSIAVSGFISCGQISDALHFKNRLEKRGGKLDLFAYNAIIEYHAARGDLRKSLEVIEEILTVGHKLSHFTESLVLRGVFRTGLGLPGCLDWIEEHKYEFSRASLQAMLEESLSLNDRQGASEVLELMRKNAKWAKVRTYNSFINYFANNEDIVGALRTFNALQTNSIVPTAHSFYLVALAAVRSGKKLGEVQELLDSAMHLISESYFAYTARALLAARRGEDTCTLFHQMHEDGLIPDDAAFEAVFESMARREENDMAEHALNLVHVMGTLGLRGSRSSMNALLKVLRNSGEATSAVDLLKSMSSTGQYRFEIKPNFETYELVLEACGIGKRMDLAVGVFREFESQQTRPTVAMYSTLVQGFGISNDFESALGVWKEMKTKGLRPNRTAYMRMVETCMRHPTGVSHACNIIDEMSAMGFSVEQQYYDTLIRGYGRARDLQKAVDLFRGMPLSARQVDEVTFGAMLNACSTSDALPTVEEALDRMVQHGIRPTRQVMDYFSEGDGRSVSKNRNKVIQDLFGLSGVDIVRQYLPKRKADEYEEFKDLLNGNLSEPRENDEKQEKQKSPEEVTKLQEKLTREKALERPGGSREIRKRIGRRRNR